MYKLWTMVYGLLVISLIIVGSVRDEIWAWDRTSKGRKIVDLILLTMFWVVGKESNNRVFEGVEEKFIEIRDKWLQYLGASVIGYPIHAMEDLGNFISILNDL